MKKYILISVLLLSVLLLTAPLGAEFKLPGYEKFVMKNGLTVYLMEQHEVPLVSVSLVVPAGAVKDGKQYGLASLTADALMFGTKNYTKNQLQDKLDFLGTSLRTYAGQDTAGISASFVKKDLPVVMSLIKEIVAAPVFDEKEIEKRKKRLVMELKQAREIPNRVQFAYYNKFIFGDHAYGNPVRGLQSTVESITRADIQAFYKANYMPMESAVALVGDFDTPQMKKTLVKLFKDWKVKGKSTPAAKQPLPAFTKNRVLLVNKDDATETQFLIGGLGIAYDNPDYVPIRVINTILGGRFTSWLNGELRVKAGLTYGAQSHFVTYKDTGVFMAASYTRTAKTGQALELALKVLNRLHTEGVDKETLESAKNYVKGQYPPRFERSSRLAALLTDMYVHGLDESFINDFQSKVDAMTVERAKEIIKKYFPIENLQMVLIGKAEAIREIAKKYGDLTEKQIKEDTF